MGRDPAKLKAALARVDHPRAGLILPDIVVVVAPPTPAALDAVGPLVPMVMLDLARKILAAFWAEHPCAIFKFEFGLGAAMLSLGVVPDPGVRPFLGATASEAEAAINAASGRRPDGGYYDDFGGEQVRAFNFSFEWDDL